MKTREKMLAKAVVVGLLTISSSQIVWASDVVTAPFTTADAIKTVASNGVIEIESQNINGTVRGINGNQKTIDLSDTEVAMNIKGFLGQEGLYTNIDAISVRFGNLDIKKLDLNFSDLDTTYLRSGAYGVRTFIDSNVNIGADSKINISGKAEKVIAAFYTGADAIPSSSEQSKIVIGDRLNVNVLNTLGSAGGIRSLVDGYYVLGKDNVINVTAAGKEASGIFVWEKSKVVAGENTAVVVRGSTIPGGHAQGIEAFDGATIEMGKNATIDVAGASKNYGVVVDGAGSMITLNGGTINVSTDNLVGRSIDITREGKFIGNEGVYNIKGDINAESAAVANLSMKDNSSFKGKVTTVDNGVVTMSLKGQSVWDLTGASNLTNLVSDNSIIDMRSDGNTFNSLTVENLSGNNGKIKMDIDAKNNLNNSDKIYVKGNFTGTQYLDLYEVNNYAPIDEEGVGTVLASVKNGDGKFLAKDGEGTLYWKRYELAQKATEDVSGDYTTDWYLKGVEKTVEPTTSVEAIMSAVNYHTWRNENDKLMKRMGELRLNGENDQGVWVRMQGAKIGRDGNASFKNNYKAYELGYDQTVLKTDSKTRYVGGAFTYTDGNSSYESGNGDNSSKSLSLYATEIGAKGHYIDVVLKASTMDNDFKVYDSHSQKITGDMNNKGVSLSAEYGRKNKLENGWYYEPQAQFTLGRLSGDDYTTSNGIKVGQSSINTAVARMGINVGKEIGNKGIVYAKVNLLHEFAGDYDVTMRSGSDRLSKSESFNDTWFEYGIGAAFTTSKNGQVYFDVERSSGNDFTKDWQWNVGARWTF